MLRGAAQRLLALPAGRGSCGSAAAALAGGAAQQQQRAPFSSKPGDDFSVLVQLGPPKDLAEHVAAPDGEIGMCSGNPQETYQRKARVFSPARVAGQQGVGNTVLNSRARPWRVAFETQGKWINPLMGWTSTADPLENVGRAALTFPSQADAVAFCAKHGWAVSVEAPQQRRTTRQKRFAGYGDNFSIKRAGVPDLSTLPSNRGIGGGAAAAPRKPAAKASQ